jgi:hypothetical protein
MCWMHLKVHLTLDVRSEIHVVDTDLEPNILLNKPFKDHLKQLYSEWLLGGDHVLTLHGQSRSPVLCQWIKTMPTELTRNDSERVSKVLYI